METRTFCGICEASCGLIARVHGDDIESLRPDPEHPNSRGYACPKGVTFDAVRRDPDRVLQPLQRQADGSFQAVAWTAALDDIARRLAAVMRGHGGQSVGVYIGNPVTWNYAAQVSLFGMAAALKTRHLYSALSLDINNYLVVSQWLYGNNLTTPFPDIARTHFLLVLGANPVVSHGSMLTIGHVREAMLDVVRRGGRVVVVDPRRSETARLFEHLPIRPDADAWLVGAMLKTLFDEDLVSHALVAAQARGIDSVRELVAPLTPARAADETGIAAQTIAQLARDFAGSPSAALYMRCGASLGQSSTLAKYLVDAFNLLTGNLDRPGGMVLGHSMIDGEKLISMTGQNGYGRWRSRVDGVPEVFGTAPAASMAREATTPGAGQLRALFICSGNPVTSVPNGCELESALSGLDLLVALDPYVTETSRLAHYVLPPTLWLEREGMPIFTFSHSAIPYAQWTGAVAAPLGEARDDSWIIEEICRRVGVMPSPVKVVRWLAKLGVRLSPRTMMDVALRTGPDGDLFGLRPRGLSRSKLCADGRAVTLSARPQTGQLRSRIHHRDRLVHLDQPQLASEVKRLVERRVDHAKYPWRLIGMRELRTQNSWLHNVAKLMAGGDRGQRLIVHPADALGLPIGDGAEIEVSSAEGSLNVPVRISDEVMPGTVALQQGWQHRGTWRLAVAAGGANYNRLTSSSAESCDRLSGQARLNGVPVCLRAVGAGS